MEPSELVRDARRAAALTQAELAERAGTVQSAVAAYESGSRTPSVATLERLVNACDHEFELVARPRVRRGAASLSTLAQLIEQDLKNDDEPGAVRLLFGFADDFRGSARPGKIALIGDDPRLTGDPRFDAVLAALAELLAAEAGIPAPRWVNHPTRFVEPWWFLASRPAFHAYVLANTPALFARHGVFIAREVFDRV